MNNDDANVFEKRSTSGRQAVVTSLHLRRTDKYVMAHKLAVSLVRSSSQEFGPEQLPAEKKHTGNTKLRLSTSEGASLLRALSGHHWPVINP